MVYDSVKSIACLVAALGLLACQEPHDAASNDGNEAGGKADEPQGGTDGSSTSSSSGVSTDDPGASTGVVGFELEPSPNVIRVQVSWSPDDGYALGPVKRELSGTAALLRRAQQVDPLGSFVGVVSDPATGEEILQQTIGIGVSYRELTKSLTFRFPAFTRTATFTLFAPDPETGEPTEVLTETIEPDSVSMVLPQDVRVTTIREATAQPALAVTVYAEGYLEGTEEYFLESAQTLVDVLENNEFPGIEHMEFTAVFAPSTQPLGSATDLGFPVPVWDSFLTLYYPYWSSFSRWHHVMYPTDEERFRDALAQAPYDYPFILTDSSRFWGAANYNAYTVVPAGTSSFTGLVLHEFGHYFGLHEEYSSQDTELLFAPSVSEPWSPNMTFQTDVTEIKWASHIDGEVPIPTPSAQWPSVGIGAYAGGYAGEDSRSLIPVPDGQCMMSVGSDFCDVCSAAMHDKIEADLAP